MSGREARAGVRAVAGCRGSGARVLSGPNRETIHWRSGSTRANMGRRVEASNVCKNRTDGGGREENSLVLCPCAKRGLMTGARRASPLGKGGGSGPARGVAGALL